MHPYSGLIEHLEHDCRAFGGRFSAEDLMRLSTAISLRRIADALWHGPVGDVADNVTRFAETFCPNDRSPSDEDLERLLANMRGKAADNLRNKDS